MKKCVLNSILYFIDKLKSSLTGQKFTKSTWLIKHSLVLHCFYLSYLLLYENVTDFAPTVLINEPHSFWLQVILMQNWKIDLILR